MYKSTEQGIPLSLAHTVLLAKALVLLLFVLYLVGFWSLCCFVKKNNTYTLQMLEQQIFSYASMVCNIMSVTDNVCLQPPIVTQTGDFSFVCIWKRCLCTIRSD